MEEVKHGMMPDERWGTFVEQVDYGIQILGALILVFGMWVAKNIRRLKTMQKKECDGMLIHFTYCAAGGAALEALQIKTASLLALIGTVGLAVGLALQGSLSNFAAGVMLLFI